MPDISLFYGALWIILGVALGALAMFYFIHQKQKKHAHDIVANAEDEAKKIIERAEKSANIIKKEIDDARADLKDRKKTFSENA